MGDAGKTLAHSSGLSGNDLPLEVVLWAEPRRAEWEEGRERGGRARLPWGGDSPVQPVSAVPPCSPKGL